MRERLGAYYTRYYRDTLGLPAWHAHVAARLDDRELERRHLARLERVLDRPVRGLRLLNLGCGTGGFNAVAESAGASTWGVDPDRDAVGIARLRFDHDRAVCARAEALPFRAETFDVVYCFSTLEHVPDARAALHEAVRVLRCGGALYVHTPDRRACFEGHYKVLWIPGTPRAIGRAYLALRGRPTAFLDTLRPLTLAECRRWLEDAGARITRVLDGDVNRPVGRFLWPLVRLYYRLAGVTPYVEILAKRPETV